MRCAKPECMRRFVAGGRNGDFFPSTAILDGRAALAAALKKATTMFGSHLVDNISSHPHFFLFGGGVGIDSGHHMNEIAVQHIAWVFGISFVLAAQYVHFVRINWRFKHHGRYCCISREVK